MTEASSTTGDGGDFNKFQDVAAHSSATNHKEAVLNCCICQKVVTTKKAKLLPCLHTLCSPCEITAMNEKKLKCLLCNQYWQDTDITNHFLVSHIDLGLDVPKCEVCTGKHLVAKFKCQECGDYLCIECGHAHKRVKMTKDHTLKEVETNGPSDAKCSNHPNEDLAWYCLTCEDVTCQTCQLQNHPGHQYTPFQQQTENFRREIKKMLDDNGRTLIRLKQVKDVTVERLREVTKCENDMRLELRRTMSQIQQAVTERGHHLLAKIEKSSENKRRAYLEIKSAVENIETMSRQATFFMEASLSSTNDIALFRSLRTVTKSLNIIERLKQEKRSSVNADLQLQVQLSLNLTATSLLDQIRSLGDVIIDRIPQQRARTGNQQRPSPVNDGTFATSASHHQMYIVQQPVATQSVSQQQVPSIPSGPIARPTYSNQVPTATSSRQRPPYGGNTAGSNNTHAVVNTRRAAVPQQIAPAVHPSISNVRTSGMPTHVLYNNNVATSGYQQQIASAASRPIQSRPVQMQQQQSATTNMNRQMQQQGQRPVQTMPNNSFAAQPSSVIIQQMSQMDPNQMSMQNYALQMPPSYAMAFGNSGTQSGSNRMQLTAVSQQQFSTVQQYNFVNQSMSAASTGVGAMPRLQYGPSMMHTSRMQSSQPPGVQQTSQSHRAPCQLQRAAGATQMSSLPQLTSVETSITKQLPITVAETFTLPRRNNANDVELRKELQKSSPAIVIQLSPNPDVTEEFSKKILPSQFVRSKADSSPATRKDDISVEVTTEFSNGSKKSVISVDKDESDLILNPSTFNIKPVSRLAKKSIATLMDTNTERKGKEPEKNISNVEQSAEAATSSKNTNDTDSSEKLPHYLNEFPMTQAFIPTVDDGEDNEVFIGNASLSSSLHGSGVKENAKCVVTPLVYKGQTNSGAIEKSRNNFERVTPDASVVTTTTGENCNIGGVNRCVNEETRNSELDDNRWDDYCSVCQNGGDLMCCEAIDCTRVFHCYHHVPQYTEIPNDSWKCGFCVDPKSFKSSNDKIPSHERVQPGLTIYEQKSCERILLELYCHSESPPFHYPVESTFDLYYQTIKHPMDFSKIREKLNPVQNPQHKYTSVEEFLNDLNRVFINCDVFNDSESDTGKSGKLLAVRYVELAQDYFPELLHVIQTTYNTHSHSSKRKRRRIKLHSDSEDSSCSSKRSRSSPYLLK